MKKALASTFHPSGSHPPSPAIPEVVQVAPPAIPIVTTRPVPVPQAVDSQLRDFHLARDLALFARVLRRAPGGRRVMAIFVATIVITIGNMVGTQHGRTGLAE